MKTNLVLQGFSFDDGLHASTNRNGKEKRDISKGE